MNERVWNSSGITLTGQDWSTWNKPVPLSLCSPQIPHKVACKRTRTSAVEGARLLAWAMALPQSRNTSRGRHNAAAKQLTLRNDWQRYIKKVSLQCRPQDYYSKYRSGCNSKDGTEVSKRGACVPKERAIRPGRMENRFKVTDLTSLNSIHFTEFRPRRQVIELVLMSQIFCLSLITTNFFTPKMRTQSSGPGKKVVNCLLILFKTSINLNYI
jgi:hypothetical protein